MTGQEIVNELPSGVRSAVGWALAGLREHARMLESARETDRIYGGNGRYEWETHCQKRHLLAGFLEKLALFRKLAPENGVDAEAVIEAMGGVADYELSARGKAYGDDTR